MVDLCKKLKEMKGNFLQFQINHVFGVGIISLQCLLIWFKLTFISQLGDLLYECLANILHTCALVYKRLHLTECLVKKIPGGMD